MSKIKKITLIRVLAFFIFGTFLANPLDAQDLKPFENGLRLIIREDRRNPIVVFSVFMAVGAASEKGYEGAGISHLIEHMLFKGTSKYPKGDIEDILDRYGGKIDGFTSYDYTGYRITILKEHKDVAIDILKEMLTAPLFDPQELEKEKDVIMREMDLGRDDPGKRISRLTFSNAYTTHPYRLPIIGFRDNFERLKREDLIAFFDLNYRPEKTVVAVVGDIDRDQIYKDMMSVFGDIPRGGNIMPVFPEEPLQIGERYIEEKMDIEGGYLNIAFHSTSLLDKDLYALDLLSFILGQGESSILNKKIRLEKELVESISSYNYTPKDPGLFIISSVLEEKNTKEALGEILDVIDDIKENGVTEEELQKAKNNFIAGYVYEKETIESKANDLAIGELLTGNSRFFDIYIEHIKSVEREELKEAAKRYLDRENMTVAAVSGSGDSLDISSGSDHDGTEERAIKKVLLTNDMPLLISQNPSLPMVSISLVAKGGLRFETAKLNGIAKLTSLMFTDGTDSMSRQEIAQFCEYRGMILGPYSANNSMGISIKCLKTHTEDAMKILADLYLNSGMPEKELAREKDELIFAIDTQDNQLFRHGHRLLKELLFKIHPYGYQEIGTRESLDNIKREDVLKFHDDILSAGNLVLGVAGDCDPQEIELLAEKYFSKVPSKNIGIKPPPKEPLMTETRKMSVETKKEQSLFLMGFHGIDVYSKERYAAEVMIELLSSQSGVLFQKIRDDKGLSYAQGAFQVLGIDPGYVAIYVLTSRKNMDKVKEVIFREINSFIKKGPSQADLEKAKNHLKAMHQMDLETNSGFIFMACLDELYGLGYDNYKAYNENIDSVSKEDVKEIAAKVLDLDRCGLIMMEGLYD